jgi:hypothetical protein
MATPTHTERDAFLWMQGRMVELLLRHDAPQFRSTFGEQIADQLAHPLLARYRDLAVLFYLREELFDSILPRIKRRLSFAAPRELMVEDLPPRGRIDWGRTMTASWRDRPGETPLAVQTRQRRRHFATPENLLTVATLLEYRTAVQHLLDEEMTRDSVQAVRHPLHEIADACTRELAFLQFAGLVREAGAIVEGYASATTDDLELAVADNLLPGRNSAYDDLLGWRHKLRVLHLLDRTADTSVEPMLGANPQRDNYLYQLWLFYELGDLLQHEGRLVDWSVADMHLTFTWGSDANQGTYILTHDRGIPQQWENAPGVRPDLYIARADREEIRDGKTLIWHEPGYVLDAKYYKPRDSARAPASPVKRMIADLQLTGERNGALLFAFQQGDSTDTPLADEPDLAAEAEQQAQLDAPLYQVMPNQATTYASQRDATIAIWRIQPQTHADTRALHQTLTALLDRVHQALRDRVSIECHGFLPDVDTINPGNTEPARCPQCGELLAFCPKPHVGADRVDRVCPRCDCLRSKRLCHILGRAEYIAPPFVKRILTQEDLLASVQTLRAWLREHVALDDASERADQAREQLLRTIGELTESYVKLTRADTAQTEYWFREWVFREHWSDEKSPRGLPKEVRNMLISGEFVWMQFQASTIEDWAACAVQYTRALEHEIHRRLYDPCGLRLVTKDGFPMKPNQFSIGTVMFLYSERKKNANWDTLLELVARPSSIDEQALKQLVIDIEALRLDRNKVAHTERVDATLAGKIRELVLGHQGQPGVLYRLCSSLNPPTFDP